MTRAVDWFFRDKSTGRIVIGQWPNLPLWLFGITALIAALSGESTLGHWSNALSRGFLVWWAGDELLRGVNPWRRCLGAAVLIALAVQLVLGA